MSSNIDLKKILGIVGAVAVAAATGVTVSRAALAPKKISVKDVVKRRLQWKLQDVDSIEAVKLAAEEVWI